MTSSGGSIELFHPKPTAILHASPEEFAQDLVETGSEVSANEAQRWVDAHNKYRCMHGAPDLKWSAAVAQSAQEWANRGVFSHSKSYKVAPPAGMTDCPTYLLPPD